MMSLDDLFKSIVGEGGLSAGVGDGLFPHGVGEVTGNVSRVWERESGTGMFVWLEDILSLLIVFSLVSAFILLAYRFPLDKPLSVEIFPLIFSMDIPPQEGLS
jgi:hypothetical protein